MTVLSSQGRWFTALALMQAARRRREGAVFAAAAAAVGLLGVSAGGFYPTSWGWASLSAAALAICALVLQREPILDRRDWLMLGAGAALVAWMIGTSLRPGLATNGVPASERAAFYLLLVWAALLAVRRETVVACLAGVGTAAVGLACAGLATVLFPGSAVPNVFEGRLLYQPLGYANAAAILAGVGALVAMGFAAHGRGLVTRTLAAASLVPLAMAVELAQSRGAELALAAGVAAMLAASTSRRLLASTIAATLPIPLLGAWAASRTHVSDAHASSALAAHDGRMVFVLLVLLTVSGAAVARQTLRDGGMVRSDGPLGNLSLAVAGLSTCVVVPAAFVVDGAAALGDRTAYWHVALVDYRVHAALGSGPGSFADAWLRYRSAPIATLNAHSLYLETLAELGPVGLVALIAFLTAPLVAVPAARRRHALAAPAAGAYIAFLVHAAIDWDWQMPAVTAAAFICGVAILAAARRDLARVLGARTRGAALLAVVAAGALTTVGLAGNIALSRATAASRSGSPARAVQLATAAARWQPWSAEPLLVRGEAQLAAGDARGARQSFRRAVRLAPQDWRGWYELGSVSPPARPAALRNLARLDPLAVTRLGRTGR